MKFLIFSVFIFSINVYSQVDPRTTLECLPIPFNSRNDKNLGCIRVDEIKEKSFGQRKIGFFYAIGWHDATAIKDKKFGFFLSKSNSLEKTQSLAQQLVNFLDEIQLKNPVSILKIDELYHLLVGDLHIRSSLVASPLQYVDWVLNDFPHERPETVLKWARAFSKGQVVDIESVLKNEKQNAKSSD
jgi:hypothetical protein